MSGTEVFWTQEAILEAIRAYAKQHGHAPTTGLWKTNGYGHPHAITVWRAFPNLKFAEVVRLAGEVPLKHGPRRTWTNDRIAEAMLDWLLRTGRWPRQSEWARGGGGLFPCEQIVRKRFGTWKAAKQFAGWRAECVVCDVELGFGRADQLYCSRACCRRAAARRRHGVSIRDIPEPRCSGCDRPINDEDEYTIDCNACWHRRDYRAKRAVVGNGTLLGVVESPLTAGDSGAADGNAARRRPVVFHTEKAA